MYNININDFTNTTTTYPRTLGVGVAYSSSGEEYERITILRQENGKYETRITFPSGYRGVYTSAYPALVQELLLHYALAESIVWSAAKEALVQAGVYTPDPQLEQHLG